MIHRISAYVAGGLAALVLWVVLVYTPMHREKQEIVEATSEIESELQDFHETIATLPGDLTVSDKLEASRSQLHSALYAKEDILRLLDHFTSDASRLGLTTVEISPHISELLQLNRSARDPGEPDFLNLTYTFTGSYIGFGEFLNHLEQEPYFRGINSCQVNGTADSAEKSVYSVSFKALLGQVGAAERRSQS
ncbi:MAG: hypothetical protein JSU65_01105 [Candidatus Zixiibacteriota bacterium]|nr:MAG: hypothetical protein JSU65_01105 [candidate division Zixibacteria bacterium]